MSPRLRKALSIGVGVALLLSAGIFSRVFGRHRLRFQYLTQPLAPDAYRALSEKPGWSESQLEVAPGIRLKGLVRRPSAATSPWVVFYSGNDANMLARGQDVLTRIAGPQDFGLAVFAYRGYCSSDGRAGLMEIAGDAPNVLRGLARTERIPPKSIHVVGFSIGGHFAVRAVASEATDGRAPASLSLLASVDDIVMVHRSFYEALDPGDDYQTRPFLGAVPAPVLVLQGTSDQALGGPEQGRAIAQTLGTRARYVELSGLGHEELLDRNDVLDLVRTFIFASK